jgi:uncharacterized membrane protein
MLLMMPATGAHRVLGSLAMCYASMVATLVFALCVGAAVSVCSRQTTVALVAGYAANIALLFGIPALFSTLQQWEVALRLPSPLIFLISTSAQGLDFARDFQPWLINLVGSTAVSALLLVVCVMVFNRRWMQDR